MSKDEMQKIRKVLGFLPKPMANISMGKLAEANESQGMYWFSESSMKFFGTGLPKAAKVSESGKYAIFWSSEKPPHGDRVYSVRAMDLRNGVVSTVGEFGEIQTPYKARKAQGEAVKNM